MSQTVEMKIDNLERLYKILKKKNASVKVGILGSKSGRDGKLNNATIGAMHEFGTTTLTARSFLRMPLILFLKKKLEAEGALDQKTLRQIVELGDFTRWLEKIGIMSVDIILEAFSTGGFGKWTPSDFRNKKVHMTLIETGQLRDSISYEVKAS